MDTTGPCMYCWAHTLITPKLSVCRSLSAIPKMTRKGEQKKGTYQVCLRVARCFARDFFYKLRVPTHQVCTNVNDRSAEAVRIVTPETR